MHTDDLVAERRRLPRGFADFQTRVKVNLWGNDGGKTALAIMPFVKWPLPESGLRNGQTEGGVICPLAIELPAGWSTTLMTECDFISSGVGGYDADFVNSITFSHDIASKLAVISSFLRRQQRIEFKVAGAGRPGVSPTASPTTSSLMRAVIFGVTRSAPDFNPFVGFSFRF